MKLAILQARMASTRLPGKVLRPLMDVPMILQQWRRIVRSQLIDHIVVATSTDESDDILEAFCKLHDMPVFRGAHTDVLARFLATAEAYPAAQHVIRLTADCPLADPDIIDKCIRLHLAAGAEFTSNCTTRTYPKGLDVEVMTRDALLRLGQSAGAPDEREHVTLAAYRHPESYRIASEMQAEDDSWMRWTVDTEADFKMVAEVYKALYPRNPAFTWHEVKAFLAAHPQVRALNAPLH